MPIPEGEHAVLTKSDSDAGKEADKRAKVEKAKSKGRFQIIENEEKARAPKSQVGRRIDCCRTQPYVPNCLSL